MALWGNNDAVGAGGTVSFDYSTLNVTGTATTFGNTGAASVGDIIKFGPNGRFGSAVIISIASTISCSVASSTGLSGVAIAGTTFQVSQLPKYVVGDSRWNESNTNYEPQIYGVADAGIAAAKGTSLQLSHQGWVGIQTYNDSDGNLRVKSEVLVAMSGITTGNIPVYPNITQ